MDTDNELRPIDTLRIDLPGEWVEFPTTQAEADAFLRTQAQVERLADLAVPQRRQYECLVRRLVNDLGAEQCSVAALYAAVVEPEAGDPESEQLLNCASLTLSTMTRAQLETPLSLSAEVMLAAMTSDNGKASDIREVEPPQLVELPVGRCVRTRRLQRMPGRDDDLYVELYLVPIEPEFEDVLMVQFVTPTLDMAKPFSTLFEAMAQTVALYREGEPTPA